MDEYGDVEGIPEKYAIDGDYLYWRPIAPAGTDYPIRILYNSLPPISIQLNSSPRLLDAAPYAVIYRACAIASIWLNEDQRVPMFEKLAERAIELFTFRHSMSNDAPREMEEYDG